MLIELKKMLFFVYNLIETKIQNCMPGDTMTNEAVREIHYGLWPKDSIDILSQMLQLRRNKANVYVLFTTNCGNQSSCKNILYFLCVPQCVHWTYHWPELQKVKKCMGFIPLQNKDILGIFQKKISIWEIFKISAKPFSDNFYAS